MNYINLGKWSEENINHLIGEAAGIKAHGDRITFISEQFLGVKYGEFTLTGNFERPEKFVVNLEYVDCFTFIDYVEAMRLSSSFLEFKENLKKVRYQAGKVAYGWRNHFFTDWVFNNRDFLEDVTKKVGGSATGKILKFLNIKEDGTLYLEGINKRESEISYIPSVSIDSSVVSMLKNGDYVGIYTEKAGLDVSHVGILVKKNNKVFLRHASSLETNRKVVDQNLLEYLSAKPGILVLRPRDNNFLCKLNIA